MKMHQKISLLALIVTGATTIMVASTSRAELVVSKAQINAIKEHCVANQASLNQLHQTDAFLRIDRGNLYKTISDKLMVPLNRRIAANGLDGGLLVATTAQFNNEYKRFYAKYISYDTAISNLLSIDCTREPVSFYDALVKAREARTELNSSTQRLVDLARQYKTQFDTFRTNFRNGVQQ